MTLRLIDLYNDITGQAWSMFDGDVEAQDEFESSVTSSIQKALSALWCSYHFPFREKNLLIKTKSGKSDYVTPNGNIIKKVIKNTPVYSVKYGNKFLSYEPDYEVLEEKTGEPESFYIKNDKLYLYPIPDGIYNIVVDYHTFYTAKNSRGISKATLEDEDDYIDIPVKYEHLFKMALMPLAMIYAIASDTDENHSGYQKQYNEAYKNLVNYCHGFELDKRIGW